MSNRWQSSCMQCTRLGDSYFYQISTVHFLVKKMKHRGTKEGLGMPFLRSFNPSSFAQAFDDSQRTIRKLLKWILFLTSVSEWERGDQWNHKMMSVEIVIVYSMVSWINCLKSKTDFFSHKRLSTAIQPKLTAKFEFKVFRRFSELLFHQS